MKNFKRIASAVAAIALAATMAVPMSAMLTASAATEGGITFTDETVGTHTYKAYKIFSGEASGTHFNSGTTSAKTSLEDIDWAQGDDAGTAFLNAVKDLAQTVNTAQGNFKAQGVPSYAEKILDMFAPKGEGVWADNNQYTLDEKITGADYVAQILAKASDDDASARAFAKFIAGVSGVVGSGTTLSLTEKNAKLGSDGYYLIVEDTFEPAEDDTAGATLGAASFYLLGVYDKDTETAFSVKVKSDSPSVEKKVKENQTDTSAKAALQNGNKYGAGYNDTADYCIGDIVPFELLGTLPSTKDMGYYETYKYIFHDTLNKAFTLLDENDKEVKTTEKGNIYDSATGAETDTDEYDVFTGFGNNAVTITIVNKETGDKVADVATGFTVYAYKSGTDTKIDVVFTDIKSVLEGLSTQIGVADYNTLAVKVDYNTRLNDQAVIARDGQQNKVNLEYSSKPSASGEGTPGNTTTTPDDQVIVFTYEVNFDKVNGANPDEKLDGANFYLYKVVDGTVYFAVIDQYEKITGWVTPTLAESKEVEEPLTLADMSKLVYDEYGDLEESSGDVYEITGWTALDNEELNASDGPSKVVTSKNNPFKFIGLDDGTYYLHESLAPDGYVLPSADLTFKVEANTNNGQTRDGVATDLSDLALFMGSDSTPTDIDYNDTPKYKDGDEAKISVGDDNVKALAAQITNSTTSDLPSTGGIGTTLFYLIGGTLVVGAGVTLITKKRMQKD